ncbi:MAG: hypothetical protein KY443_09955 [Actinobacteria bacterium]|nr:hypothetical protein [Actinomycetota bacterium]
MTNNGDNGVMRAERIEVVDGRGRVRLVLGDIGNPERPGEVFGCALLGVDGRQRAWLAVDDSGASLGFDRTGNAALELGVDEGTGEAVSTGAYLHLSDMDGRPVLGWRVEDDGEVVVRAVEPER